LEKWFEKPILRARSARKMGFSNRFLGIQLPNIEGIERANRPTRLPIVLTRAEIKALFAHLGGIHDLIVSLLYGIGMRIS
jgi:integrase